MIFGLPKLPAQYVDVIDRVGALRIQLQFVTQNRPRRWSGLLRRSTFARAIQASNSIEGYNVTIEDAVAAVEGEDPLNEKTEAWLAVSGYRNAMSYILQLADDPHYVHNAGTVRSLHYMMMAYDVQKHPGRWRPGSIFVRREPAGEIVYEGPDAELVPGLMHELIESLNARESSHTVVAAALAHLNLVMIHPFSDGNGRMGRALQTLVLARDGVLDPTFSSIEEYLGHNTAEYYDVLGKVGQGSWHPKNNALPWIRFCLVAHYRQAETLLRRTKELERIWNLVDDDLKRRGLNDRLAFALSDAALGYRVRNATYRASVGISEQLASRDLQELVKQDLLVPQGEKRGRYYVAGAWLKRVMAETRLSRVQTDPFLQQTGPSEVQPVQKTLL